MKKSEIRKIIDEIVENDLHQSIKNFKDNVKLTEIGIDSISFMVLIVGLEEKLNIQMIDDLDVNTGYTTITLSDLVCSVEATLNK